MQGASRRELGLMYCVFILAYVITLWREGDRMRCMLPLTSLRGYLPGLGVVNQYLPDSTFHTVVKAG